MSRLIDMLEEFGLNLPRSCIAKVRDERWELRPEWAGTEYRCLYFTQVEQRIIIVHALTKKAQKLRPADIDVARA
jgi:phage-related protein